MARRSFAPYLALLIGLVLMSGPACSKQSVSGGPSSTTPDLSVSSKGSGGGERRGLDSVKGGKSPSEERVGDETLVARAEPSDSRTRLMEEMRKQEMAATRAAGFQDVFFAFDSWTISEEGRQALNRDAEWIKANPKALLKIEGHCDERGTQAYNLVLGEKRAKAVRNYLADLGVGATRLSVVSYGKERPFCKDHEEFCYQQNRRGHLVRRTE
jgi:peptidoglycan-associated lipoprotein